MRLISKPEHGQSIDALKTMYPSILVSWRKSTEAGISTTNVMGYVVSGTAVINTPNIRASISERGFFSSPGPVGIEIIGDAQVVTIERLGYRGPEIIGNTEDKGRLSYIDGCSDSMLVPPCRMGDAVLNLLHFPPGILQTQHTHPSIRLGIVAKGEGIAWYEGATDKNPWEKALIPGAVFCLEEQEHPKLFLLRQV